jgi:hypothetical protein
MFCQRDCNITPKIEKKHSIPNKPKDVLSVRDRLRHRTQHIVAASPRFKSIGLKEYEESHARLGKLLEVILQELKASRNSTLTIEKYIREADIEANYYEYVILILPRSKTSLRSRTDTSASAHARQSVGQSSATSTSSTATGTKNTRY